MKDPFKQFQKRMNEKGVDVYNYTQPKMKKQLHKFIDELAFVTNITISNTGATRDHKSIKIEIEGNI